MTLSRKRAACSDVRRSPGKIVQYVVVVSRHLQFLPQVGKDVGRVLDEIEPLSRISQLPVEIRKKKDSVGAFCLGFGWIVDGSPGHPPHLIVRYLGLYEGCEPGVAQEEDALANPFFPRQSLFV